MSDEAADGFDHHVSEALSHLHEARTFEIEDEHVRESVNDAVTECIVARERQRLIENHGGAERPGGDR